MTIAGMATPEAKANRISLIARVDTAPFRIDWRAGFSIYNNESQPL